MPDTEMDEIEKRLPYFDVNRQCMRYTHFRELGLCVGSDAVEAGRKAEVAHRLKQSGMRWTVRGSAAMLSLRCQQAARPSRPSCWDLVWQ